MEKITLIVAIVFLASLSTVGAAGLGTGTVCPCNSCSTCSGNLTLTSCDIVRATADLSAGGGTCIDINESASNKTFDCMGHTVKGYYLTGGKGLYGHSIMNATIQNCVFNGTGNNGGGNGGVWLMNVSQSRLINDTFYDNEHGIVLSDSIGNRIVGNIVENQTSFGIYILSTSTANVILNSTICYNPVDIQDGDATSGSNNACLVVHKPGTSLPKDRLGCTRDCATDPMISVNKSANVTEVMPRGLINWTISVLVTGMVNPTIVVHDSNMHQFTQIGSSSYNVSYVTTANCSNITNVVWASAVENTVPPTKFGHDEYTVTVLGCNDHNICTDDACDNATGCVYSPNTDSCDDGLFCTINDACSAGACSGIRNCDDGDSCTVDSCNESADRCINFGNDSDSDGYDICGPDADCNDSNAAIHPGARERCDDDVDNDCDGRINEGCTGGNDECNSARDCPSRECKKADCRSGSCVYEDDDGTGCDDGNDCTSGDSCSRGSCVPGRDICSLGCRTNADCEARVCKTVSCVEGECAYEDAPEESDCDDGNACTVDKCRSGKCSSSVITCFDGNVCTDDRCDVNTGCAFVPNSEACDDGDRCTSGDACSSGRCSGTFVCECRTDEDCDDGRDNTLDVCVDNSCEHRAIDRGGASDVNKTLAEFGLAPDVLNWTAPMVYKEEKYTVTLEVFPKSEVYTPGNRIERALVGIFNTNGTPVNDANVTGICESLEPINLSFIAIGNGTYEAPVNYVISIDEDGVVYLKAHAKVAGQNISKTAYLLVESKYFYLVPKKPEDKEAAPGQVILFEAAVEKIEQKDELAVRRIELIDERNGKNASMSDIGDGHYSQEFTLPQNAYDTAYFIVLAEAIVNGKNRTAAYRETIGKKSELSLKFDKSAQDPSEGYFALEARYINDRGNLVNEKVLFALVRGYPSGTVQEVIMSRNEDSFLGEYKAPTGDTSAEIEVLDSYGNRGVSSLPPEFFKQKQAEEPWILVIAALLIVGAGLLAFRARIWKSEKRANAEEKAKTAADRKEELQNLIKRTKEDFYKKRITQEQADARLREYEEELAQLGK